MEFAIVGPRRYKIGTIVRLTGFSQALLRTWERRYQILSPERGAGRQRLYTEEDLRLLRVIREQLAQGRTIGEVVLHGREGLLAEIPRGPSRTASVSPKVGQLEHSRAALVNAAIALDKHGINRALDDSFATLSPDAVISGVIEPAARYLGELWEKRKCTVAAEHLATACFLQRGHKLSEVGSHAKHGSPGAIVACLPGEMHSLGALIVSYYLGRGGYDVYYFGAALPLEDLETACRKLMPRAVCLSSTRPRLLKRVKPQLLNFLRRWHERTYVILGGSAVPVLDDELTGAGAILWSGGRLASDLPQSQILQSSDGWPKLKE
jgi:MerR family transcriptional regulator, light-induced transcriptional regulator